MDSRILVSQLVASAVPLALNLVAIAIALVRYRVHPTVSVLAIAAFATNLGSVTLAIVFQSWLVAASQRGATDIQAPSVAFGLAQIGLGALFLILITTAVFIGRSGHRPPAEGAGPLGERR